MTNPVDALLDTLTALRSAWVEASGSGADERGMSAAALLDINQRIAGARRLLDGVHARVAAEMSARSRPEFGSDGLARQAGFRSPAKLIAAATGGHTGDAVRLIQVGEATRERTLFSGEAAPARHPHIARALHDGMVSVAAASAISAMLDRVAVRVDADTRADAETALVRQAPLLSLDELHAVLRRAEAHLDPDGLEPVVGELHGQRSLKIQQDATGMTVLTARLDAETAAPIVAAIDAIVTTQLRTSRGHNTASGLTVDDPAGDAADDAPATNGGPVAPETRSLPQMRADALAAICRHASGCDQNTLPKPSTAVVVRMDLSQLREGAGVATIDGIEQPIDAGTARRMAAAADLIPCVLGTASEVLDFGRARRHFSAAQRLALVERDGGCAFCHLPPAFAEAHHIRWWQRDGGTTDLANGILLCTSCHHRVHADNWEIRIEAPPGAPPSAGTVWFIPPSHVDPHRAPRLGGRRRFDPLAYHLVA
ncbi:MULTISPECIES: HNH endonuclease [Microbacterium]|uniref:HNH endonuclease n=1 Tax=Microbacterium wangchenii TaxID=2541726 RepID=A0ABX5ST36_9MICO|nr:MULTISPECIES: HNH endonuclease signature motif containing protein [Microbacterium]MCK6064885.1 HNH endonuclease [Microbacterium sp. EYE_512]QBR88371.1 HNH endonuclease [Microbacterium wangchenii]TXK20097.1 DUF222 domain-containing protein [Microbacterium wangchenii]